MKKIFILMAAALMSIAMMAGENDLLWDYMEKAPSNTGSDNGLTWNTGAGIVNDATGTKNGLKGLKMNGSGYCYFTKAAVAGKLKLTFGPRDGSKETQLEIFTWTGETPKAETSIALTGTQTESGTQVVELSAAQNNIFIQRKLGVETVLQKIEFKEDVARTFVDFEMDFRADETLIVPTGVEILSGASHGDSHGYTGLQLSIPVDGPVKFTIGGCQYANNPSVATFKNSKNEVVGSADVRTPGCYHNGGVAYYTYTGEADVLTFIGGEYTPYLKAEAVDVTPCEIIFKDQNGTILGKVATVEGASLEAIPYSEADLPTFPDSEAFRGWFYTNGKKAKIGDPINGNTTIQAKVTPIEYVTVGSVQTYDFASQIFYPEDHETVEANNGAFHDAQHGWYFTADGSIRVQVAGNAVVVVTLCKYSESGDIIVANGETELNKFSVVKNSTPDGTELTAQYKGDAVWLTISWTAKQYIHKIVVYNVLDFLEKDESTGYFIVPTNDAASLLMALVQAESGDKIFLPNGTYDLGETCLTTIGRDNISIIGQSMEGVIIKNAPLQPGIGATATLKINKNVQNTYLQDLTLFDNYDYYKNDDGVGVALQDQGTKTICKNVRLLGFQDTYYSNLQGAVKYFEDCEIHGTVDFICGDGSVYFKNNLLYAEKRKKDGGGQDALTASNAAALDRGYVFEGCTIKSACPTVSLGRAWNNTPQTAFLNTLVDCGAGNFSFSDGTKIQRWTKELMNKGAWPQFVEYNTHLADGTVLTPTSNMVEFYDPKDGNAKQTLETVIAAEGAATYTMEYTLGSWATTAAAEATQVECEKEWTDLEADAIYMAECEGEFVMLLKGSEVFDKLALYDGKTYILRKANARGGFGAPAEGGSAEAIDNTVTDVKVVKVIRDGQVMIIRDNKIYNVLGVQL